MLGLVLTPYGRVPGAYPFEINKSGPDSAAFLCPRDPYYFQRGEYGFYYDTPLGAPYARRPHRGFFQRGRQGLRGLGAIPTDAEIGKYYTNWYTPVQSGWVYAQQPQRYIPGPWVPPDNATAFPPYGPPVSPPQLNGRRRGLGGGRGLGEASAEDMLRVFEEYHRDSLNIAVLTGAFAVMASIMTIVNNYKKAKHEHDANKRV